MGVAGYKEALDYLFARTTGASKFGLERTEALLEHLGRPHEKFRSIHVAGTNGKGSSIATMEALLRAQGLRVARYTSPHLVDFRERIVVDGAMIGAGHIVEFVRKYTPLVEELGATFFEATTAMAFDYIAQNDVDVALIEAGLGGRLDSTNVITPIVAGVTSIGYDHTEYLGTTLESIAAEKAGIFKAGRPAVIGERDARIRTLLAEQSARAGATPVRVVAAEFRVADIAVDDAGTSATIDGERGLLHLRTPLAGEHQAYNLAFALAMLDAAPLELRVSNELITGALSAVTIPGRFQHSGRYIFDVAHNADGAAVLARTMKSVAPPAPVSVVFCALRDKDWREMLRALAPVADHFVLTMAPTAPASRAWDLDEAHAFAHAEGLSAEVAPSFESALERARLAGTTILITGSFHTVGDAMARLQASPESR